MSVKKSRLLILALIVLALNIIWEFSHYRLYTDLTGIPSNTHLIMASFADLILISLIFSINSILRRGINWIENPKKVDYFVIIILGMLIAGLIEIYSVSNGRWAYKEAMPTILGIGLSPLIQLFTTAIVGLWSARILNNKLILH